MKPGNACRIIVAICVFYGIGTGALSMRGGPIQFGSHYYEFVSAASISWTNANVAAAASNFLGATGHLATVMSAAENNFLSANFATYQGFAGAWLGGMENVTNGGYWVVGPYAGQQYSQDREAVPGAYANWGGIEPNNPPSAAYINIGTLFAGIQTGQWADAAAGLPSGGDPIVGYFVQYDFPVAAPVLSLTVTNSTCLLSWTGLTNVTYAVQMSTNLASWVSLGAVTATGTNVTFTDANLSTRQFYRLKVPY